MTAEFWLQLTGVQDHARNALRGIGLLIHLVHEDMLFISVGPSRGMQ